MSDDIDLWDNRELGADERYVALASEEVELELQCCLDRQQTTASVIDEE